jgi:hypothetical protein
VRTRNLMLRPAFVFLILLFGGLFWAADPFEGSQASGHRWLAVLVPAGLDHTDFPNGDLYPEKSLLLALTLKEGGVLVDEIAPRVRITGRPAVSYDGRRILFAGREGPSSPAQIWESGADGSGLRRLLHWDTDCVDPAYLPDGSIVFGCVANTEGSGGGPAPISLYRLVATGNAPERITFGLTEDRIRGILPDGRILYLRIRGPSDPGTPMAVRPDGTEMARYISDPPSRDEMGPLFPAPIEGRPETGLYLRGSDEKPGSNKLVFQREGYRVADLVPVRPAPLPPVATSVVDTSKPYGFLLCLDAKASDIPSVREAVSLVEVRVLDDESGRLLGHAPIEEDGSFFLKVPADRPLRLELLDRNGTDVGRQQTGSWVRPNETRGCVGCHEPRTLAPENRVPMAILRDPVAIGRWGNEASE